MYPVLQLLGFWAAAFLSLAAAVILLSIYFGLIGNDLELLTAGKEIAIAAVASLVEATGLWLIILFVPAAYLTRALRAMILPFLIVGIIYKLAHLVDWSRYDVFMLLSFQFVIGFVGLLLLHGQFQVALAVLLAVAFGLVIFGAIFTSF
jgi:hypothetical protein